VMSSETFMGLLAPNLQPLRKLLQVRLGIPVQADDVLQQALLRAFARRDQLRLRSKFKSWLWTIALNEMRMFFRGNRSTISLDEFPNIDPSDRAPSALARYEQIERLEWLREGLKKLSGRDRTVIIMRDLDGLSIAETAEALAVSETAVKSTHFRARQRLARALRGGCQIAKCRGVSTVRQESQRGVRNMTAQTPLPFYTTRIESITKRKSDKCLRS
jgi:RNA polymerase sigma-70 factor (ECF subfamily)